MIIKNYKESGAVLESEEDDNVKHLMGSLMSMILTKKDIGLEDHEEVDLVVLMKIAKVFFKKKHLLNASLTGDWSSTQWWPDES